jgi:CBS domain-containing protein
VSVEPTVAAAHVRASFPGAPHLVAGRTALIDPFAERSISMPSVRDILAVKGSKVLTVAPGATVMEAVDKMNRNRVGALVVMDGDAVAGIFTERDVLQRVIGFDRGPRDMFVAEVMTADVLCCEPDADVEEVAAVMKERRVRHLPVCADGGLIGMVSIGDVNAHYASNQQAQISFLNEYIYGRA